MVFRNYSTVRPVVSFCNSLKFYHKLAYFELFFVSNLIELSSSRNSLISSLRKKNHFNTSNNSKKKSYLCLSVYSVRELTPFFAKWIKVGSFLFCMVVEYKINNGCKGLPPETGLPLGFVLIYFFCFSIFLWLRIFFYTWSS